MLGAVIGDIVGSTREWHNIKTEDFELVPTGSRFTDDSVMTLAVAQWLMTDAEHKQDTLVECMQWLGRKYPRAGYGRNFSKWLESDDPKPYGSYGNGSAMRVSPVGLYAKDLDEALELAKTTALVSHNHPEGIKGAQAVAACVFMRKNGYTPKKIKEYVEKEFGYSLDTPLEEIRPGYTFHVSCQKSVPIAIMAFLQRDGKAEETLRLAVSMGGDSDTIGCMACSIATAEVYAGGKNGLSAETVGKCRRLLPADLLEINDKFEAFVKRSIPLCKFGDFSLSDRALGSVPENEREMIEKKRNAEQAKIKDRIRGSLMAGAAGDALGYEVEFMRRGNILSRYGEKGITAFHLDKNGKALVSDDTQMTLFTANGLLMGITRLCMRGIGCSPETYLQYAYEDWYYTQTGKQKSDFKYTWLRDLPEMAACRAPGNTCLGACESRFRGEKVENNSRGCGGIMRVAPVGLFYAGDFIRQNFNISLNELAEAGAVAARFTHLHPLGWLPAALQTVLVYRLATMPAQQAKEQIDGIIRDTLGVLDSVKEWKFVKEEKLVMTEDGIRSFIKGIDDSCKYLKELTVKALQLAHSDLPDDVAISSLGEGWVAEETWAIAVYCAVRHIGSIRGAITASVNHDGDSDSTGSVTGNIIGAVYGYETIKEQNLLCPEGHGLEETLELSNIILALADDLNTNCIIAEYSPRNTKERRQWYERYCEMKPSRI